LSSEDGDFYELFHKTALLTACGFFATTSASVRLSVSSCKFQEFFIIWRDDWNRASPHLTWPLQAGFKKDLRLIAMSIGL
jgi:hypothetical protein